MVVGILASPPALVFLACGVLILARDGTRERALHAGSGTLIALQITVITAYTSSIDGIGVRNSSNAAAYTACMFLLPSVALLPGSGRLLRGLVVEGRGAFA